MKYILMVLSIVVAFTAYLFYDWGAMRNHKEVRYATMIDTYSNAGHTKSGYYYNTNGLFRDKLTGKVFGDSINDSLYRQFEKGGNKGIEVSWPYSIDKYEQTSIGFFSMMLAWLMWGAALVMFVVSVMLVYESKGELK